MAFELLFFKHKDTKIILKDVVAFFTDKPNFLVKPLNVDNYSFEYKNPQTNVAFKINYNEKDELITELTYDENYGYCFTSFSMNYTRPSFFALEAMPIVEAFSQTFNLYINDIQSLTEEKNALKLYTKAELMTTYLNNNQIACIEFNNQFALTSTDKAKTDYFYEYTSARDELEKTLNVDVVIPDISFLKNITTEDVFTVISWDDCIPTLLPKVDYVLVIRAVKGFLGRKKQSTSLVPYEELFTTFKDLLEKTNSPIHDLYFLTEEKANLGKDLFYTLNDYSHEDFEIINVDEIVDVKL